MNAENLTNFDSFGVVHVPKEIRKFTGNAITNIYWIQAYVSIMCIMYNVYTSIRFQ